ncbi:MAG TPA: hypothetical protein DIW23_15180 [Anaerolineae bacterium]|nr:hypothetical protein [Anaerolineae bacterium]
MNHIAKKIDDLLSQPPRSTLGVGLMLFGFLLVWAFRLYIFGSTLPQVQPIFWIFLWASFLQVIGLKLIKPSIQGHIGFVIIFLFQGFVFQTIGIFRIVSADPFSIGYSEAGRFYYASLFFSDSLYGNQLPLPFLHPSRYLLLSIPYLLDGLPLWAHRFWQALLWFGLTLTASFVLIHRFKFNKWITVCLIAWAFLYFFQGAVYYHLQICVILILAGVSLKHPTRSLIFIILASLWAGISRVNWFPVPAMIAITIYILETPINDKSLKYWMTPFVWGIIGVISALISQFIYIQISGNADISAFGSSFTSDLLWKRLLPNDTYPMGILPGIALVSLPLWLGMYQMLRGNLNYIHPLRWLALLGMVLILFIGGAIVSTKIGGGGDLHNMDAYLVLLSVLTMFFLANQVSTEKEAKPIWGEISWGVIYLAVLILLWFALPKLGLFHRYDEELVEKDIQALQQAVSIVVNNGGEVLFITERQLITFNLIDDVSLVPEYEQSELMEMAMSRNRLYLDQYYVDLQSHRFALIVAEGQKFNAQKRGAFMEEDNAWVRYVGVPLLCNYRTVNEIASNNINLFVPREEPVECKDPFVD